MRTSLTGRLAGAITAVAIVAACQTGGATDPPGSTAFSPEDVSRINVTAQTLPAGWTIDRIVEPPADLVTYPTRSSGGYARAKAQATTLLAGRAVEGLAPEGIFVVWTALFEDTASADRALAIYQDDFVASAAWGLNAVADRTLGESAIRFTGDTTRLVPDTTGDPVPTRIYLWQVDSLLLAVGGFFDADPDALLILAKEMDARAH
jgi:hypothetical protein